MLSYLHLFSVMLSVFRVSNTVKAREKTSQFLSFLLFFWGNQNNWLITRNYPPLVILKQSHKQLPPAPLAGLVHSDIKRILLLRTQEEATVWISRLLDPV